MIDIQKPRPVFIAAMHREIAALVRDPPKAWNTDAALLKRNIHLYWNENAVIACAGMGANRARLAVDAALQLGPASELISIGWAGSCNSGSKVGDVLHPTIVVDTKTGERFFSADLDRDVAAGKSVDHQILVTVPTPANIQEKAYLAMSYYAVAVDMEAAAVARVARAREIPFHAIKAISDAHDFELPDLSGFTTPDGQFREAAFGLHLVTHPSLWNSVRTMAKGSTLAAQQLRLAIDQKIDQSIGAHILKTGRDLTR
jgi:adenosylhomocysteine nucleosidase